MSVDFVGASSEIRQTGLSQLEDAQESKPLISSDFQTFLSMLTTQLQNQDPLNPMESSDFAVQLATFSGVEQQVQTNSLLSDLGEQIALGSMVNLAGWVGMEVEAAGPVHFSGQEVSLSLTPVSGAVSAMLGVHDASGRLVQQQAVGPEDTALAWQGISTTTGAALAEGAYSFTLTGYDAAGRILGNGEVRAYAPVAEVRQGAEGAILVRAGGQQVAAAQVTGLRVPGE